MKKAEEYTGVPPVIFSGSLTLCLILLNILFHVYSGSVKCFFNFSEEDGIQHNNSFFEKAPWGKEKTEKQAYKINSCIFGKYLLFFSFIPPLRLTSFLI